MRDGLSEVTSTRLEAIHPQRLAPDLLTAALGLWLGLQTMRLFFGLLVWNIRENLPEICHLLGFVLVGAAGPLAPWVTRLFRRDTPERGLAAVYALFWMAALAVPHPIGSALLSVAAAAAWLCWLPAQIAAMARRGALWGLVPGVLVGMVLDVGARTVLHGLDLPVAGRPAAIIATALLVALFIGSSRRTPGAGEPDDRDAPPRERLAWGPVLLGPYLFLHLTLLGNFGRTGTLSDWGLLPLAALLLGGLLLSAPAMRLLPLAMAAAVPLVACLLLLFTQPPVWLLVPMQAGAAVALAHGFRRQAPAAGAIYRGWALGSVAFFLLVALVYAPLPIGWPGAWMAAALILTVPAVSRPVALARTFVAQGLARRATLIALAALGLGWTRMPKAALQTQAAPAELRVMTYNIRHGFDFRGVPAFREVASFLEARKPDLVALQEISRGGLVDGGVDFVAYLRRRLPQYQVVFGATREDVSGNAILSRYPVLSTGRLAFPLRRDRTARGLIWVTVPTVAGNLVFASTHLAGYRDQDREAQTEEVLRFWDRRPRTAIAGDLNFTPDDEPAAMVRAAGLIDAAAAAGPGEQPTFRSNRPFRRLDYVWTTQDMETVSASVPPVVLSDHLPLEVTLRILPSTARHTRLLTTGRAPDGRVLITGGKKAHNRSPVIEEYLSRAVSHAP
jgi:endonuclease/exonuclease/phosphatase family metal-dependent hydrolase